MEYEGLRCEEGWVVKNAGLEVVNEVWRVNKRRQ